MTIQPRYSHFRARKNRIARREIAQECFSSPDETPDIEGKCDDYSYHETLKTTKGTLELRDQWPYEEWIPRQDKPVVSVKELRKDLREETPHIIVEDGHGEQPGLKYTLAFLGGFQIITPKQRKSRILKGLDLKIKVAELAGKYDVCIAWA